MVICIFISLPAQADLKKTIADKLGIDPGSFVLNLPPRPGCLPGSIFTDDLRVPLVRTKRDDPQLQVGPVFQFSSEIGFDAAATVNMGVASWFGAAAKASDVANAVIEFRNARVLELLGPELKRRVQADPDALAASARRVPPFAVLRAFEGSATLRLGKKNNASAEAWAKAKQGVVDATVGASVGSDDTLVITVAEPFVFGFEIVQLNYVTQRLGSAPDNVILVSVPDDLFQR